MKTVRYVPLGPALQAAVAMIDRGPGRDPDNEEFSVWYNEPRHNNQSVLHYAGLPVEVLQEILPGVPLTPAGIAWKASAEACLALTLTDVHRPFDRFCFETDAEHTAANAITAFAEDLTDTSPLLTEVAAVVEDQSPLETFDINELWKARKRITNDGIIVGSYGKCDKHDDTCYEDTTRTALWHHIEAMYPNARTILTDLLATFDAFLPTVGEDDNGKARKDRDDG